MSFMERSQFPQELVDIIIDNLRYDKRALIQTSLVASSWLPRSRRHKFRQLVVSSDEIERRMMDLLRNIDQTPEMARFAQHLLVQGEQKLEPGSREPLPPPLTPHILALVMARLPKLRTLQLHELSFRNGRLPPRGFRPFSLDELVIMSCGSMQDTARDVRRVLSLFSDVGLLHMSAIAQDVLPEEEVLPDLDEDESVWSEDDSEDSGSQNGDAVEIDQIAQNDGGQEKREVEVGEDGTGDDQAEDREDDGAQNSSVPPGIPPHLRVKSVKLEDVACDLYLETLQQCGSIDTLRSIEVDCTALEDALALSALLSEAGSRIEHLAVDLSQYLKIESSQVDDTEQIDVPDSEALIEALRPALGACTALKSFHFSVSFSKPLNDSTTYHDLSWDCLLSALRCTPSTVNELSILLSAESWPCSLMSLGVDWASLRDVWKRLNDLKNMTFALAPGCEWQFSDVEKAFLGQELEELRARGVLQED